MESRREDFVVALNPDADSRLPFLVRIPLGGGLDLKARDSWPRSARVYCHPLQSPWPEDAEVVDTARVVSCRRRGAAVDLVLDRPRLARSQFVFTEVRGRPAIFWQTQKAARAANPGGRVPRGGTVDGLTIAVDTRERYPYRFAGRAITSRVPLVAGDYAVLSAGEVVAIVERKTLEDFATSLGDGTLAFQMQRLGDGPAAAVVVEGRYSGLFKQHPSRASWLAEVLARLQVRYPEVQVVFADSRKFAEDWTHRFLANALADAVAGCAIPAAPPERRRRERG